MKKSFSLFKGAAFNKLGFLPFLMTFLFFAAMQVDMKAQSSSTTIGGSQQNPPAAKTMYQLPAGPFTTVEIAKIRLQNSMKALKDVMAIHAEGTAPYNSALRTYTYHSGIYANLEAGKGVAESIVGGLEYINNSLQGGVTPEEAVAEKNAAINMLRP
jgi:hypothetical protein